MKTYIFALMLSAGVMTMAQPPSMSNGTGSTNRLDKKTKPIQKNNPANKPKGSSSGKNSADKSSSDKNSKDKQDSTARKPDKPVIPVNPANKVIKPNPGANFHPGTSESSGIRSTTPNVSPAKDGSDDYYIVQEGYVRHMVKGLKVPITRDIKLSDGNILMIDGTVKTKDLKDINLDEGTVIDRDGNILVPNNTGNNTDSTKIH
jgi:hypothetical protein